MKLLRDSTLVGFALFAMFFGAGNIIFPPYLGLSAGTDWISGFIAYFIADIGLACVAIYALVRSNSIDNIEGIMARLGKIPGRLMMSAAILCIGPLLAIPRTAAITFEMTVAPLFSSVPLLAVVIVYFIIVGLLSVRESALVGIVGKYLTPLLIIGLMVMIIAGVVNPISPHVAESRVDSVIWEGVLSGYQTLDVLAALIFGLIIANALKNMGYTSEKDKATSVMLAAGVAGLLLFIVYCGLCYLGSTVSSIHPLSIEKGKLVIDISQRLLGSSATAIFGLVVMLACLTTAIALVGSAATFFNRLFNNAISYVQLVVITCVASACVAMFGLSTIISIAAPILMIVYPPALVVVCLSLIGDKIKNDNIFRFAALGAILVSSCEVIFQTFAISSLKFVESLPFASFGFSWIVPAAVLGVIGAFIKSKTA